MGATSPSPAPPRPCPPAARCSAHGLDQTHCWLLGVGSRLCGLGSWRQKCLNPAAGLCDVSSLEGIGHVCKISAGRARNTWDGLESGMQLHFYVHFRKESMSTWLPGQRSYQGVSRDIPTNTPATSRVSSLLAAKSYCNLHHLGSRRQGPYSLTISPKDRLWVNPL